MTYRYVAVLALATTFALSAAQADAKGRGKKRRSHSIAALTADGKPNIQAAAAVVLDAETGTEYFSKNADAVRYIASTGKIFVALVVRARELALDGLTEITKTDAAFARGGARTRLMVRHSFKNIDLLRAMLIASDNRAPTALGRAVGLTPEQLVAEMNALAKKMGLRHSSFTDPSGLRGNVSTAREMATALAAVMRDPVLAKIVRTHEVDVRSIHSRPRRIHYRNTNKSLLSQRFAVNGGKTGFTDKAGYCLLISAKLAGRPLIMAFYGTKEKLTRFGDFNRAARWFINSSNSSNDRATAVHTAAGISSAAGASAATPTP